MRVPLHHLVIVLLASCSAQALEWQRDASVGLRSFYTDNFCLSRDDQEGQVVSNLTLNPGTALSHEGARARVNFNGRIDLNSLDNIDNECANVGSAAGVGGRFVNREPVIPNGSLNATFLLIDDFLTLESHARAGQNAINPFVPGGNNAINGRGNTNLTYIYGVGATANRRLGSTTEFLLRYRYDEQFNSAGVIGDSQQDTWEGRIQTRPSTGRLSYSVAGRSQVVKITGPLQNESFENELKSVDLTGGLRLTRRIQLTTTLGEEFNVFTSANDDVDGRYWDVGLRWTPNSRFTMDVGYGERFFGETPRLQISYRHKRRRLSLSYARSVQFPRNIRAPQGNPDDLFGDDFGSLPSDPVATGGTPTFVGGTPLINEQFQLQWTLSGRLTSIGASVGESRQRRAEDLAEGLFRNVQVFASRSLSGNLSLAARIGYRESEGQGASVGGFGANAKTWITAVDLSRTIGRRTSVTLGWAYNSQRSDFVFNEFDEQRITLNLNLDLL